MDRRSRGTGAALLQALSRRTTSGRYVPVIDGLRFVAILLVLIFHVSLMLDLVQGRRSIDPPFGAFWGSSSPTFLGGIVWEMKIGVQVFFAVSGFVLSLPWITARNLRASRPPLGRYYLRRVTRIEPPYVVALTVLFLFGVLARTDAGVSHYLSGLLYLHGAWFGAMNPYDAVTWSLEVEIQFYVLVPLLALVLCAGGRVGRRLACVLIAVASIWLQVSGALDGSHLFAFLGNYLQFFMVGWLLGDIFVTDWDSSPPVGRRWDLVTLIGWPALLVALTAGGVVQDAVAPWFILALAMAAFRGPWTSRALSTPWVATIGGMCYSIYLTHYPVMILMRPAIAPIASLPYPAALVLGAAILFPMVLLVGAAFFVTVERPCMDPDWARRVAVRLGLVRDRSLATV